jgi:hypothetical protein
VFRVESDGRCRSTVAAVTESFPLISTPYVISSSIRVCGVLYEHDEYLFPCPGVPLFYMMLHERGSLRAYPSFI